MSALADLIAQDEGQCIDLDHAFGCQCVDLAQDYANRLGHPLPLVAGAKDFAYRRDIPGWSWIGNTPDNAPLAGDVPVWDVRIGPFGHIDVGTDDGNLNNFPGLDQNWFKSGPNGSPAARVTHTYYGVAGWLRPDPPSSGGTPMAPTPPFYVNVNGGASWFATPQDGTDAHPQPVSAAGLTQLKIVEVVGQPDHFYYRWEGGGWWLRDVDCTQTAPPAPTPPPASDLDVRFGALEGRFNRLVAGQDAVLDAVENG